MRHDSPGIFFLFFYSLSSHFILQSLQDAYIQHTHTTNTHTHTRMHSLTHKVPQIIDSYPWFLIFIFYNVTIFQMSVTTPCSLSHIHIYHLIIIDKKYTLSYVYWDHTNTSQGYIDIRFFSLYYFFPSFLHGRHQASRLSQILRDSKIARSFLFLIRR